MNPTATRNESSTITVTADVLATFSAAFPSVDEARLARAVALVNDDHCERLPTMGLFLIRSASRANRAHTVDACTCSCEDFQKRGGMCMHRIARSLFLLAERADAEETDPTPDAAQPPAYYELTGKGYLTLIRPTALPPLPGGPIQRVPVALSARAAQADSELYPDEPLGAA